MYYVRNKFSFYKQAFPSYEKARQFIRKQLRKKFKDTEARVHHYANLTNGYWDMVSRNPSAITGTGYSIVAR